MAVAYLEKLNEQQRKAVEHGVGLPDGDTAGALFAGQIGRGDRSVRPSQYLDDLKKAVRLTHWF